MDSDPRLVVFFIILSTNPKMLQMMNILVLALYWPNKKLCQEMLVVNLTAEVDRPALPP